jgi:hypothetical protein
MGRSAGAGHTSPTRAAHRPRRGYAMLRAEIPVITRDHADRADGSPRGNVVTALPHRVIAAGFTTVHNAREGAVAVAPAGDCGCRRAFDVTMTKSPTAGAIPAGVDNATKQAFGAPTAVVESRELRPDHEPQYTGRDTKQLTAIWQGTDIFAHSGAPLGTPSPSQPSPPSRRSTSGWPTGATSTIQWPLS